MEVLLKSLPEVEDTEESPVAVDLLMTTLAGTDFLMTSMAETYFLMTSLAEMDFLMTSLIREKG